MKTVKVMVLAAFVLMSVGSVSVMAAEKTVKILAPWQGHGQVFKVAPEKLKVIGSFDGIMYIDGGNGDLDAAIFMCPGIQKIDLKTKKTSIEADCVISKGKDRIAYATLTATGKVGASEGTFTLVGGEGKWKGISGEGKVVIRTAMGDIAVNEKTGAVIDKAAGLAVWPALKVNLPK
jgi:hypothetical protein